MLANKNDLISFSSTYFYFKRNVKSILVYTNDTNEELCKILVNDKRGVLLALVKIICTTIKWETRVLLNKPFLCPRADLLRTKNTYTSDVLHNQIFVNQDFNNMNKREAV